MTLTWHHKRNGWMVATTPFGVKYEVRSEPYGTRKSYEGFVDGERIPLSFSGRRKDAQKECERHHERVSKA